jgi:DNA-binding XRE family transcriptional regulator
MVSGKTQREAAKESNVDQTTIVLIERDVRKPFRKTREKLKRFVEESLPVSLVTSL